MSNRNILALFATIFCLLLAPMTNAQEKKLILVFPDETEEEILIEDGSLFEIFTTGDMRARATSEWSCEGGEPEQCPECPSCDDVEVSMQNNNGSFAVSPVTVTQGGNVSFNWTSRGAWSCQGGGLPNTDWNSFEGGPSGTRSGVSTSGLAIGKHWPSIECCNGPECDSRQVELDVVEAETAPEGCEGRSITHLARASRCVWGSINPDTSVDCSRWASFFGTSFPGGSSSVSFYQEPDQYLALEFNSGNLSPSASGGVITEVAQHGFPSTFQGGDMIWTISTCPGDFNETAILAELGTGCYRQGGSSTRVRWEGSADNSAGRCTLQPDTRYFLNIVYTDSASGTSVSDINWACTGGSTNCGRNLEHQRD